MNKREMEDVQARLRMAGFKLKAENCEDSCLFCNHYHLTDGDRIPVCELLRVEFGNNFEPEDCICRNYDGGIFDSLVEQVKKEEAEKMESRNKAERIQTREEIKPKDGKIKRILNHIGLHI